MNTEDNRNKQKVFISYARADTEVANRLYNDLKLSGLDPWLDTKSLLGGDNWRVAIKDAIKSSRYFITLLSSNSVEKIGYVQHELKEALEILHEFPQSKRFIIPVRMDESKVIDEKLAEIHIIDLFPDWKQGIQKILMSMGLDASDLEVRGKAIPTYQYDEWNELLHSIVDRACSPIIGPEAYNRWIPSNQDIAIKWAEEHGYPFHDRHELPQVAQFMAIEKNDDMYPKKYLRRILKSINLPNFSAPEYEKTIYRVLADLNLPIYITTNYDHLMEKALIDRGKKPMGEFFRWNSIISEYAERAGIPYLSDEPSFTPSSANPIVFHLHGDMDHPLSMVLTEQDNHDFLFNISKAKAPLSLPYIVSKSLTTFSQLFIGFALNDVNSRNLFRSIAGLLSVVEPPYSVAIMSNPLSNTDDQNLDKVKSYLGLYAKKMSGLNILWTDLFLFSIELLNSINKFRQPTE